MIWKTESSELVIKSLDKAIQEVNCLMKNNTFTFIFVIVNKVDWETTSINIVKEEFYSFSFSISMIYKECFEGE